MKKGKKSKKQSKTKSTAKTKAKKAAKTLLYFGVLKKVGIPTMVAYASPSP